MNALLAAALRTYQRHLCGCAAPHSCCQRGLDAAATLPLLAALTQIGRLAGDCQHEHPGR
jgi:hypothetical protein